MSHAMDRTPEEQLRALCHEREINDVLVRYCRGIDRLDEELLRSVYHDDAYDDHGVFKGTGPEFVSWVIPILRKQMLATTHLLSNVRIELDGDDRAHCESYVIAHHRRRVKDEDVLETVGARYADRVERRDGEWRIASRLVLVDWSKVETMDREFPAELYQQGERSRADGSYTRKGS